jgi:hypothetical protein
MDLPQRAADSPRDAVHTDAPARAADHSQDLNRVAPRSNAARRPLFLSLVLVGSLVAGVLAALTPRYETNDDVGMNAIAAGRMLVDQPDEHVIFSNVLIGYCLKSLYQTAPNIPWYGLFLFGTASISLVVISFVCLRQNPSEWRLGLTAVLLWVVGVPSLTLLQFTRVAALAGVAGLLLLFGSIRTTEARWLAWCAVPFLLVGALLRIDAFLLVCVVLSPAIAWMAWRACLQQAARMPLLLLLACVVAGFGAGHFNAWYYSRSPEWRDFLPFNAVRVNFIDWNSVQYEPQMVPVFDAVGWQKIDLQMLKSRAFLDRDRFTSEKLDTILKSVSAHSRPPAKAWRALYERLLGDGELWGLWACGAVCLGIFAAVRTGRFVPLACYGVTGITCLLLYQRYHLPARVYCPAFSACAITALFFSEGLRSLGKRPAWVESLWGRRLALTLIGALIAWRSVATFRSNANFLSLHRDTVHILEGLAPKPNQLFVAWGSDFPFEFLVLPLSPRSLPRDFKVMGLDWTTGFAKSRMREFGVHDLLSIVRRGDGTFFICQDADLKLLEAYFRAHYKMGLTVQPVFAHQSLYDSAVYRVTTADRTRRATRSKAVKSAF